MTTCDGGHIATFCETCERVQSTAGPTQVQPILQTIAWGVAPVSLRNAPELVLDQMGLQTGQPKATLNYPDRGGLMARLHNSSRVVRMVPVAVLLSLFGGGIAYASTSSGSPAATAQSTSAGTVFNSTSIWTTTTGCPSGEIQPYLKQTGTSLPWTWVSPVGSQCQKPDFAQGGNGFRVYFSAPTADLPTDSSVVDTSGSTLPSVTIRGSAYIFYSNCDVGLTSGAKSTSPAVYEIGCDFESYSKAATAAAFESTVNGNEILGPIQTVSGHI